MMNRKDIGGYNIRINLARYKKRSGDNHIDKRKRTRLIWMPKENKLRQGEVYLS